MSGGSGKRFGGFGNTTGTQVSLASFVVGDARNVRERVVPLVLEDARGGWSADL
jgi:hypothetical protein